MLHHEGSTSAGVEGGEVVLVLGSCNSLGLPCKEVVQVAFLFKKASTGFARRSEKESCPCTLSCSVREATDNGPKPQIQKEIQQVNFHVLPGDLCSAGAQTPWCSVGC